MYLNADSGPSGRGRPASALADVVERCGGRLAFPRHAAIYTQDEPADGLYRVVSGVVRTSRLGADGRRQVGDFYLPGDLFGLEAGASHAYAAEALSDCVVRKASRNAVQAAVGHADLGGAVLDALREALQRTQAHLLMLGLKNAREKVAAFLITFAKVDDSQTCELPMCRQDMADYLGLTIETVSRTLTQFQSEAIVEFAAARRFRVRHRQALEALAA